MKPYRNLNNKNLFYLKNIDIFRDRYLSWNLVLKDLLALVHDLLLRSHLHRRQRFHVGAIIAEARRDLLVEGVDEILETTAERAERSFLEDVGAIFVCRRWFIRVAILAETRVQTGIQ